MAVAMIYPEPEKTGRGEKFSLGEDLSSCRLSMARSVLKSASRVRNLSTTPITKSAMRDGTAANELARLRSR
jgi:hypothetical protein